MRNSRRGRMVLTLLLLAAFTLITLDYRSNSFGGVRRVMSDIFGPIEDGISHVTDPIGSWFSSQAHAGSYKSRNKKLEAQIAQLENQQHLGALQRIELAQDQKLLHIAGLAQFTVVSARVVAYGGGLVPEQTVTINKGSDQGILPQETVIDGDGLVGKTITVGKDSSTVLLADDRTFEVGIRTEAKQLELGSVTGGGPGQPMTLTLYNPGTPLTVGEQLVTIGSNAQDTPFVPEVPVGRITHVDPLPTGGLGQSATVQPYASFDSLDILGVVVHAPKQIKHDLLLPQSPKPAPTVTVTTTVTVTPGVTPTGSASSPSSSGTSPTGGPSSPSGGADNTPTP